ncbi:conserved hypothetical protein [Thermosinus carboxydivorans Nor1]|uniref:Uncharacterized protein n=1 Tax=Thermosinus carboxydivorans Nor1 TaxID=401526 RepID=A1HQ41_9FIRM|nr:hypothetical protein [Thermosinus carboxydivorans]EAX47890.1 conserved hypothetical protein [Thermosinus carboxydivorans Nor1]
MIYVTNTPNNAGVAIYGDYLDFKALYDALHTVVGDEEEEPALSGAGLRVLAVCYDLRHALMGHRDIEFVDNGMDADKMRQMAVIASSKNVYLKINVLWPEMLFVMVALNDFVKLYARKQAKTTYDIMLNRRNIWDDSIAQVRMLQAAVAKCLKSVVPAGVYSRMMGSLNKEYIVCYNYATQYVDLLNCRFLKMSKEKRLKNLSKMAKLLTEPGSEYLDLRNEILQAAQEYNCPIEDIRISGVEYPDHIDW